MDFSVEFYETASGNCPVRDFLEVLKTGDPEDFAAVLAGLAKLRNRQYHRVPLSKSLGDGLFELRHVGKLNTRILWFCNYSVVRSQNTEVRIKTAGFTNSLVIPVMRRVI